MYHNAGGQPQSSREQRELSCIPNHVVSVESINRWDYTPIAFIGVRDRKGMSSDRQWIVGSHLKS
ncbi:hypothetical protein GLOTRDRAFT_111118 [Gloeophyllum trabeum ATCC 11539]|uniref:Uncharacterized protein n=1 Tax=Gloeophyllum trabeum (strain ATCC 11539 / FP-39264 / Madison 617) TaxID=670483 RepID=S7Q6E4_GLOTA|nr:uncharacterized protein GLOTRDRAFT_111118 [Gloeophyllum trabeum ATCC 11539]EPQ55077.1 hypothetical protein GLOTRDRAFT_111118 [Gloeophyllum trabeum ATCC 11539]